MAGLIGSIGPYVDNEGWGSYVERLNLYFDVNDIIENKRLPAFLSIIGSTTYGVLKSLVSPTPPGEHTLQQCIDALRGHYCPKPLVIGERFRFMKRVQLEGETIQLYNAELKHLSSTCEFGANLEERLRDQLVVGIRIETIQRRLLGEKDLTYTKAREIATSMEIASRDSKELIGRSNVSVNYVANKEKHANRKSTSITCHRCGGNNHKAEHCKFIDKVCYNCGKKGHLKSVCKCTKQKGKATMVKPRKPHDSSTVHWVETQDSGEETYQLFTMKENANSPAFCANLRINGKDLVMEIDTGSSVSIISEGTFDKRFADNILLTPSTSKLRTYTGEVMPVVGMAEVDVEYKGQKECMSLLVVPGNGASLLGRSWLRHIQLDWREVHRISTSGNSVEAAYSVLQKYPELMRDDIGTINGVKGHLQVNPEAEPRFCKARNVPYALREKVEEELSRLEQDGIIEPVEFADWAAPIVPVLKGNGQNVRICGDFKLTVNKASRLDTYPLPRIDYLYASLAGGQSFTKLDLKNAYLQIELEEESKKFVTIKTSRGLFQYNRLPFGVSSSPAIFQRVIDNVLQRIPYVYAYLDDILVTGRTDEEHLHNIDKVLSRLATAGMRLNVDKCTFMAPEVTYLGYRIDKEGLNAVNEKVQAIAMAPAPQNCKQLRSYLGCWNYYGQFIKNLSSEIAPLNKLLTKNEQFVWGSDEENAFQRSKELLQSPDVLVHYDQEKELILSCDASPYGIGVVLAHRMGDGSERPISFASTGRLLQQRNNTRSWRRRHCR